ncbi:polysaccharide deacetylase family protein [Pontibacter sp. 172403-2]|uniref:polysaccharide deacetylase family protein n=1 Tax=Pontibacter rufus TaxID=2791028 RepID=UPI0018B00E0B|nr:polysaccharide deacetylase family protein [Pontibacter sp. 172403-2]MBF9254989.1 polysaccharide deacetylase family protein [Pontibacter sp. 172403-2]
MLTRTGLATTLISLSAAILFSCDQHKTADSQQEAGAHSTAAAVPDSSVSAVTVATTAPPADTIPADAATIYARPQVPILCYHQIRDWRASDSKQGKDYIVPVARFEEHIKMLADSGYHAILPDQLLDYLNYGKPLPPKPVMLTFDDTNLDQYTNALPVLDKYGFKGVFFVMTVSLGRPRYMTRAQVKELSDKGHVIGSHTWDHHNVKKFAGNDWVTQVEKPTRQLEEITGKPVLYFAYPFGLWNEQAIPELKQRGFVAAFQLATHRDAQEPLYTIRRTIASGYWNAGTLYKTMRSRFEPDTTTPSGAIAVQ